MGQTIDIIVDRNGNVQIETSGFSGAECEAMTKALEDALGDVETREHKPEFTRTQVHAKKSIA